MEVQQRIREFLKKEGLTPKQFENYVGLSNGACAKINAKVRKSTCDRIRRRFPQLNIEWLLTGRGEMLVQPMSMTSTINANNMSGNNNSITGNNNINGGSGMLPEKYIELLIKKEDSLAREQEENLKTLEALAKTREQMDQLIDIIKKLEEKK